MLHGLLHRAGCDVLANLGDDDEGEVHVRWSSPSSDDLIVTVDALFGRSLFELAK